MMDDLWLFSGGDWHDVSHVGAKTPPARCLSVRCHEPCSASRCCFQYHWPAFHLVFAQNTA